MKKLSQDLNPDYYDSFTCIADKCSFTCCQEWKIAVDDDTYKKWTDLGITKQESPWFHRCIKQENGVRVIELNEDKKCPFLNEEKLCNLVLNFGDEVLSKTCASFPRQVHKFDHRKEYSLVPCCPEVVDMLNQQDEIKFTQNMANMDEDILFQIRTMMIRIIQNQQYSNSKSMMMIFYILLDIYQKERVSKTEIDEYSNEAILEQLSDGIDQMEFASVDSFDENNELFLDLIQNYQKEELYTGYLEKIAALAETLSQDDDTIKIEEKLLEFEQLFLNYEKLFRNYLVTEIFTNSLMPESDLKSMLVMIQWIAMEYVTIKHAIFLNWLLNESENLSYTVIRNYIVVISRMTGYDQEDIYEYLEKSFEHIIWEWGYLALLMGPDIK